MKNTKLETLNSKQTRNTKHKTQRFFVLYLLFYILDLFRVSDLGFRVLCNNFMKFKIVLKITLIFIMLSRAGIGWGDFDDTGLGARAIGLGGAYTALADDIYALYYNPAGLAALSKAQCAAEYGKLYMGLDDDSNLSRSFLGYGHPLHIPKDKKRFWKKKTADLGDLPYTDYGTIAAGVVSFTLSGEYEERALYVGYGRHIIEGLSAGLNIKNLYEQYTIDDYLRIDPVFDYGNQDSLQTISFDFGLLYRINHLFSLGLAIWDINQPDVGLKSVNRLKRQFRWGGCYRSGRFSAVIDLVKKRNDTSVRLGAEQWVFKRILGIRAGYSQGSRDLKNYSAGMSVNLYDVEIGYAFLFPLSGLKEVSGSHRMSCIFKFGQEPRLNRHDNVGEAFQRLQKENEDLDEKYIQLERIKDKIEEKYIEDSIRQLEDIDKLKKREKELVEELHNRPYKVIKPKPKKWDPPPEYTVQEGDTLRSIAKKLYGDPLRWINLYNANRDKIKRSQVEPGQVLAVPK